MVKRLWKRIGKIHNPVGFCDGAHSCGTVINVWTHNVVDTFLGHFFHARNRALGIFLVILVFEIGSQALIMRELKRLERVRKGKLQLMQKRLRKIRVIEGFFSLYNSLH